MFRIRDLKNGNYQIHSKNRGAYEGPLNKIVRKGKYMGINLDHMLMAVEKLFINEHDYADFNGNGHLIYTQKDTRRVG